MSIKLTIVLSVLALIAQGLSFNACAYNQSEDQIMDSFFDNQLPMTLSGNRKFVVLTLGTYLNTVEGLSGKLIHTTDLSSIGMDFVASLSASRTARKIALMGQYGCVGILDFQEAPGYKNKIEWVNMALVEDLKCPISDEDLKRKEILISNRTSDLVAISSDGKVIAVARNHSSDSQKNSREIQIIEVNTGRIIERIFPDGQVMHIRFLDSNKKLLIVQALLGSRFTYDIEPLEGEMLFAVWDLQKKELFNLYHTNTDGLLSSFELMWDFNERSGELAFVSTDRRHVLVSENGISYSQIETIKLNRINLKQCRSTPKAPLAFSTKVIGEYNGIQQISDWSSLVADPQGRWIAYHEYISPANYAVYINDSNTGEILDIWKTNRPLYNLQAIDDGGRIIGRSGIDRDEGKPGINASNHKEYILYQPSFSSLLDSSIKEYRLRGKAMQIKPSATRSWHQDSCLIEDEEYGARNIIFNQQELTNKLTIVVNKKYPTPAESTIKDSAGQTEKIEHICTGDLPVMATDVVQQQTQWSQTMFKYLKGWYPTEDGLWIDKEDSLERVDLIGGKVLEKISRIRSDTLCSMPIYDRRLFLNWQDDLIYLRPFTEKASWGDWDILVKKPGWKAEKVVWLGVDRFGVRWRGQHQDSILAEVYNISGERIAQIAPVLKNSSYSFSEEEELKIPDAVFSSFLKKEPKDGNYHWEQNHFMSIRAQKTDENGKTNTVLWAGLGPDRAKIKQPVQSVINLGHGLGGSVSPSGVQLFDAETKRHIAFVPQEDVVDVAWIENESTVVITFFKGDQKNGFEQIVTVYAFTDRTPRF